MDLLNTDKLEQSAERAAIAAEDHLAIVLEEFRVKFMNGIRELLDERTVVVSFPKKDGKS